MEENGAERKKWKGLELNRTNRNRRGRELNRMKKNRAGSKRMEHNGKE